MKSKCVGLLKHSLNALLVLIAFFSLNLNVNAANFSYKDFDWDEFYEENKDYWVDYCSSADDEDECLEVVLDSKKQFYIRLYKLLAKYEKSGYKLDDNILIETAFYGLTPDTFSDLPEHYKNDYRNGTAYNLDTDDIDNYDINVDEEAEYYDQEKDSLKTLIKHMFSYPAACVGKVADPELDEDGKKVCYKGSLDGDKCVGTLKTFDLTYSEQLIAKFNWAASLLGIKSESKEKCKELGGELNPATSKQKNYDVYWKFLINSEYFDNKIHLTSHYNTVLEKTNHKYMSELSSTEREEYAEDLKKIRERIVNDIKSILETYGNSNTDFMNSGCTNASAWWPIGSSETTEENGKTFATGDPITVYITSPFGYRIHPVYGYRKYHSGIDIGAGHGSNLIAVKDGVVTLASVNGGYGNCVIIQHNDGTSSLYGHMSSISVQNGEQVRQGQVVGKVGSTGVSTGPHLHFEIRVNGNAVDPLQYVSGDNPRPMGGGSCSGDSSDFIKMLHWFEGGCNSPKNGNNYVIHDDGKRIPTVGYGVALIHNIDRFKKYGIDVTGMTFGQELPIDIVDKVQMEASSSFRTYVENYLAKASITLTDYQVDCLVMVSYQFGNLGNFNSTYPKYGNTEELRNTTHTQARYHYFLKNPSTGNGRAAATWKLFHEGIYTYGDACN